MNAVLYDTTSIDFYRFKDARFKVLQYYISFCQVLCAIPLLRAELHKLMEIL
jgi:hypothetical protein